MTFTHEDHIRVQKPLTSNGINPILTDDHRVRYKTTFLPMTAKKHLDKKNLKLPKHLQMIIEVVPGYRPAPVQDNRLSDAEKRIAELEAQLAEKEETPKNKGGRPPKPKENENN